MTIIACLLQLQGESNQGARFFWQCHLVSASGDDAEFGGHRQVVVAGFG
jgi:hypothetical protein